jgi:hypothetical protein
VEARERTQLPLEQRDAADQALLEGASGWCAGIDRHTLAIGVVDFSVGYSVSSAGDTVDST